jgi:hypothetical protein
MATAGEFENLGNELKTLYPTGTFDPIYRTEAPYRAKLKKNNDYGMSEGSVKFPLHTDGMWSVGIIADNEAFPTPKNPTTVLASLTPELFATSFQIGLKSKVAAKSKKSTFHEQGILGDRIETVAKELASYINKVYCGSVKGRIAVVESDGANNFVAAKPLGVELLQEGMVMEGYDALTAGGVRDSFSAHKITSIDYDTRTVSYVKASDGTADDRVLWPGDHIFISGTYSRTPNSMPAIVDDDSTGLLTIFGITRSTTPKAKGNVLTKGGVLRNLNEQLMLDACDKPRRRTGKKVTRVLGNSGQWRKYIEFVAADRRYAGLSSGTPKFVLGGDEDSAQLVAPGVNATLEVDYDAPPRSLYFLAWDTFFLYEAMGIDWIDADSDLLKLVPTDGGHKSAFLAYMGSVENQGCTCPLASTHLGDLKDPICGD